jgi:MoxR-like ATPase
MTTDPIAARLRDLRDKLASGLVERDLTVRLALLAALAGEHLLLLGPPGTAKSLVARRLHLAFADATYFERLLTRFTVPEELFGPLSIKGLEEDRYERLTTAYLPTASIAFLDEIFKANSAILNALLTLLNEREFDNGARRIRTPLVAVIGASNELPEGEELDALFDRFLLRLHIGPVSKEAFPALLRLRGHATPEVPVELRLTNADLAILREGADHVEVPEDVVAMLCDLRDWCQAEEIRVSDRRWRKIVKLLQVSALTNGRIRVSVWDCWLLQHCLGDEAADRPMVYEWYASRVGASAAMDPARLTRIVVSWEGRLKADQDSRSQMTDDQRRPWYKDSGGKLTLSTKGKAHMMRAAEKLYLAPADSLADYYSNARIQERTNAGAYYTVAELNALRVGRNQQFEHWPSRADYLAEPSNWAMKEIELSPAMEPTRHKSVYVEDCIDHIDVIRAEVLHYKGRLEEHRKSMEDDIRSHLWVSDDFVEPSSQALQQTQREVDTLLVRIDRVRNGFELLPRERDNHARDATAAIPGAKQRVARR